MHVIKEINDERRKKVRLAAGGFPGITTSLGGDPWHQALQLEASSPDLISLDAWNLAEKSRWMFT